MLLGTATALALSVGARAAVQKTADEQCSSLYGAQVCTAYQMRAGKVTQFSLRIPVAMIEHAPANAPMVYPPKEDIDVPFAPAVAKETGFTYANIYWNPHGHGPSAYQVPHFDFHFYFVSPHEVGEINCKDTVKPQVVPAGYMLPPDQDVPGIGKVIGACIPYMGMHSAPKTDFDGNIPWKGSLLVGFYGGKSIFLEPMITSALLLQKRSFSLQIPQGIEPAAHVRYPKSFRAIYIAKSDAYEFTFFY
ncbi:MAG: hypothetical protein ACRD3F_09125 [Acidobacteriaceae bacterium]